MQIVEALSKLLVAVALNERLRPVDGIFGPDDASVADLVQSLGRETESAADTFRLGLSDAGKTDLAQAGDALKLTANLVRQFVASGGNAGLVPSIISAANSAWEELDDVGEAGLTGFSFSAALLVLAYQQLSEGSDKSKLQPAIKKIAPETIASIRAAHERLEAWNPTRFGPIKSKVFWNIPGNGEIAGVEYSYLFEGVKYREYDAGEMADGAMQRISERRKAHMASTWADVEAKLRPALRAADVLERWLRGTVGP